MHAYLTSRSPRYSAEIPVEVWLTVLAGGDDEKYTIEAAIPGGGQCWISAAQTNSVLPYPVVNTAADMHRPIVSMYPTAWPSGQYVVSVCQGPSIIARCYFEVTTASRAIVAMSEQMARNEEGLGVFPLPVIGADEYGPTMIRTDVAAALRDAFPGLPADGALHLGDGSYRLPSSVLVRRLALASGISRRPYSGAHDCDDFAAAWWGYCSAVGVSACAIGIVWGRSAASAHAMCVAVTSDAGVVCVEPQTGQLQRPADRLAAGWQPFLIVM